METMNPDDIQDKLRAVIDPEIGINIVDLGLIYGIEVVPYVADEGEPAAEDGDQRAMITGPHILQEVKSEAEAMEHIRKAEIDLTFSPMWSEDMMSEDVRWILGR